MAALLPPSLLAVTRRLMLLAVAVVLSFSLAACDGGASRRPPTISSEDMAMIARQAEGFLAAKDRLPELANLVNERDWTFTRNLIHGPMQEVGREMLYINQRLLPADRKEAGRRAEQLKTALAGLDEAARRQNGEGLRREYIKVASSFGAYAEMIPAAALPSEPAETTAAETAAPEEPAPAAAGSSEAA